MHKVTILSKSSPNQRRVPWDSCACSEPKWPTLFVKLEVPTIGAHTLWYVHSYIHQHINMMCGRKEIGGHQPNELERFESRFPCCQQPLHLFIYCGKLSFFPSRWNALKASATRRAIRRPSLIILGSLRAQGKGSFSLLPPPPLCGLISLLGFPDFRINFISLHCIGWAIIVAFLCISIGFIVSTN